MGSARDRSRTTVFGVIFQRGRSPWNARVVSTRGARRYDRISRARDAWGLVGGSVVGSPARFDEAAEASRARRQRTALRRAGRIQGVGAALPLSAAVAAAQDRRARQAGPPAPRTAAVTFVQRFGGALMCRCSKHERRRGTERTHGTTRRQHNRWKIGSPEDIDPERISLGIRESIT